ncbi:unnamed protein product [Lathyrus sativus]|nr:unnamed protein product [Lathyrus sativus]
MPTLAPINRNAFTFPYANKWSVSGMNYQRCLRHSIIQYCNLIDHLGTDDFVWMPYEGLDHQPNPDDVVVWTSTTLIIRFTTVEMHQIDRVKLQFRMHPSLQYMTWFRSVTTSQPFLSQPTYLADPSEHDSSSNTQQQLNAQNRPYENPYMPTNTPYQQHPYMPPAQSQPQPPYHYSPDTSFEPTPSTYSPHNSFDPTLSNSNYPSTYSPDNSFDPTPSNTPQQPTHLDQPNSMYTFGQPYRPYSTQPPRQSFENMGIRLDYGSAIDNGPPGYWSQMMQNLSDTLGPSQQHPPPQLDTQRPDTPQQPGRRYRRNAHPPQCGTDGRLEEPTIILFFLL